MSMRLHHALSASFVIALAIAACGKGGSSTTGSTGGAGGLGGSGGSGAGTTTSSTSSGPCTEAWACTPWETDGESDAATRTCVDQSHCGTTANKPLESATLPALDVDWFKCNVQPILVKKCAMLGCHGAEQGRGLRVYARGRKRLAGQLLANPSCGDGSTPSEGCDGSTACLCAAPLTPAEVRKNFDAVRGFAMDSLGKLILSTKADKSELLAQPVVGGKTHADVHLFNKNDAEYAYIKNWITGSKLGMTCN
ncbi:MAG: hypothetical protein QM820_18465 [Minicystis sp.]